jgi:hypothetical protein
MLNPAAPLNWSLLTDVRDSHMAQWWPGGLTETSPPFDAIMPLRLNACGLP